jgi:hypothetical protein
MTRQNQYNISIKFTTKEPRKLLFSSRVPYLGSLRYKDNIEIYSDEITIEAERSSVIKLDEIFYNYNSSLYNQIIKSLVFFYALNFDCPDVQEIIIIRNVKFQLIEEKKLKKNEITQPLGNKIKSIVTFDKEKIKILFDETEKGKSLLIALSYWIKAMSSKDVVFTFERLWRGLNRIYCLIGKTENETNNQIALRTFTINNPNIIIHSAPELNIYNDKTLRDSFRWRGLILNDYPTQKRTKDFKNFVLRYSDERIMKLIQETLPYRKDFLIAEKLFVIVDDHIKCNLSKPKKVDAEAISLICIKYMYFVRNKSFHGEKIDGTFRLFENKETKELEKLNSLQEKYLADLINANDLF